MKHLVSKDNTQYAALTVPKDVRHIIGKVRFFQSTKTNDPKEAAVRAITLVHRWKAEIAKARGKLPNVKDTFWESLQNEYQSTDNEGVQFVIEDLAEKTASTLTDLDQASELYKLATNQVGPLLAPLVGEWLQAQSGGQKSIDQKHRDLQRMADKFISLQGLQPKRIKAWTDGLLLKDTTHSTFVRIGGACRSFWSYLQDSGTIPMETPDPFLGSFRLALKKAVRTDTGRSGNSYTEEQLSMIYSEALKLKDRSMADLIALGAYTGARVEELGRLRRETCVDGIFNIKRSKSDAGVREIPIHPAVAPLVARMLAASKDGFLVPSTSKNQYDLRMAALGQRYTKLKTKLGIGADLAFHNTRNTLITMMHRAGADEGIAADTLGHDRQTLTYGLYSSGSSMAQKREAMALVVYGGALGSP